MELYFYSTHMPARLEQEKHYTCQSVGLIILYLLRKDFLYDFQLYKVAQKNACFSNNSNFVYFQHKKNMSTPKQPVINAVLITYIDYSITENYIGKMA